MEVALGIMGVLVIVGLMVFAFMPHDHEKPLEPSKRYRELTDVSTGAVHVEELDGRQDTSTGPRRPAG